jgi:hypothetical protein
MMRLALVGTALIYIYKSEVYHSRMSSGLMIGERSLRASRSARAGHLAGQGMRAKRCLIFVGVYFSTRSAEKLHTYNRNAPSVTVRWMSASRVPNSVSVRCEGERATVFKERVRYLNLGH